MARSKMTGGGDVNLLFGVAQAGDSAGDSEDLIRRQLTAIMSRISPLKVVVKADTTELEKTRLTLHPEITISQRSKKAWENQIQNALREASNGEKFSVTISKLTLGTGAIDDFKRQIGAVLNTLNIDKGTSLTITAKDIGEITSKLNEEGKAADGAGRKVKKSAEELAVFRAEVERINSIRSSNQKGVNSFETADVNENEAALLDDIRQKYHDWAIEVEKVNAAKELAPERREELISEGEAIQGLIQKLKEMVRVREDAGKAPKSADLLLGHEQNAAVLQSRLSSIQNLIKQITDAERNWTAAKHGVSAKDYQNLSDYRQELERLMLDLSNMKRVDVDKKIGGISSGFKESSAHIREAGENTKTWAERMGSLAQKFKDWLSVSKVIMAVIRSIRQMITTAIELDDAITQLRIVTRQGEEAYRDYGDAIAETAKKIGASMTDLINSTTTFARLGYSLDESSKLAEYTAMLQRVGNIDEKSATEAVTAIIKAYDIGVDELESIMDRMVVVGNGFPISVGQIAEGMNNASSTLAAAGNDFNKSVALLTAANTTIQDAAKASTGLRTITARLRNTVTELDELDENMTEAKYQELVSALTKYNVSLTDTNNEYRATYDIMQDIAAQWGKMTSMEQAALATAVSGTRQQAVFYSIINQFQEASGAMDAMANSSGALNEAYSTYMESTTAHINQFKAAFQELSQDAVTTKFMNQVIDLGTVLLNIVHSIVDITNALGGLNTVLALTAGTLAMVNAGEIMGFLSGIPTAIAHFATTIALIPAEIVKIPQALALLYGPDVMNGIWSLGDALTAVGSTLTVTQVHLLAVVAAIAAVVAIGKVAYDAWKRANPTLEELKTNAENAAKELGEMSQKSSELEKRIRELKLAAQDGKISIVEEQELERLTLENEILEKQIKILQERKASADEALKSRAVKDAKEFLQDTAYRVDTETGEVTKGSDSYYLLHYAELYTNAQKDYLDALADGNNEVANRLKEHMDGEDGLLDTFLDKEKQAIELMSYLDRTDPEQSELYNGLQAIIDRADMLIDSGGTIERVFERFFHTERDLDNDDNVAAFTEYVRSLGYEAEITEGKLRSMFSAVNSTAAGNNSSTSIDAAKIAEQFATAESSINTLSSALKEFEDNGRASIGTLKSIAAEMGSLDSFDEFYATMLDGNATMAKARAITNKLAGEYVDHASALGILTEANRTHIRETLDKLGVLNSEEVIEDRLAKQYAENLAAELDLTTAKWEEIEAVVQAEVETRRQAAALEYLRIEQVKALASTEDITNGNLQAIKTALMAAEAINLQSKAMSDLAYYQSLGSNVPSYVKASYQDILNQFNSDIDKALANVMVDVKVKVPRTAGSGSGSSSSKSTDEYFAEVDRFRKYIKDLNDAKEEAERLEGQISRTGDLEKQAEMHRTLADRYETECDALHALNEERRKAIQEGVNVLNGAWFGAEYDPRSNSLYIRDLEKINKLTYQDIPYGLKKFEIDSNGRINFLGGNYESELEALNNYRKQLEGLVGTISGWNDSNKDDSANWLEAFDKAFGSRITYYGLRTKNLENRLTLNENWLNHAVEGYDLAGITRYSNDVVSYYKAMQENIQKEAAYYRERGYDDTSEELTKLSDLWWDYEERIKNSIAETWKTVTDNMHAVVDDIQSVYSTLHSAADEYASMGGYLSVDTFQEILKLSPKYLKFLQDENGQLNIQEQNIRDLILAQTEELALLQAKAFVEELESVKNNADAVKELTDATKIATDAQWELLYAQVAAINLSEENYQNATHVLDVYRSLAAGVKDGYTSISDSGDLLKYVMDMIRSETQEQIKALEQMKKDYKDIIDLRKEAIDAAKEEADYEKDVAKRTSEIAKLQARINLLSLDDSREAQAERTRLLEEMAELQDGLTETQEQHSIDARKDALDEQYEAYEAEKDKEIEALEDSISSEEKVYRLAIDRIRDGWEDLHKDLIKWNTDTGNSLNNEITSAWEKAKAAAQDYYGYISGQSVAGVIDTYSRGGSTPDGSGSAGGKNLTVADTARNIASISAATASPNISAADALSASRRFRDADAKSTPTKNIVALMKNNAAAWHVGTDAEKAALVEENERLAEGLKYAKGLNVRKENGVWYDGNEELFKKYHSGGIAGGGKLKDNELLAVLEKGEAILDKQKKDGMYSILEFASTISERFKALFGSAGLRTAFERANQMAKVGDLSPITASGPSVAFGDVYIYGGNEETVRQHTEVNRRFVNEVLETLHIKR